MDKTKQLVLVEIVNRVTNYIESTLSPTPPPPPKSINHLQIGVLMDIGGYKMVQS